MKRRIVGPCNLVVIHLVSVRAIHLHTCSNTLRAARSAYSTWRLRLPSLEDRDR
jgi:hypothetical protein